VYNTKFAIVKCGSEGHCDAIRLVWC